MHFLKQSHVCCGGTAAFSLEDITCTVNPAKYISARRLGAGVLLPACARPGCRQWGEGAGSRRATTGQCHGRGQGRVLGWGQKGRGGLANEMGLATGLAWWCWKSEMGSRGDYFLLAGWFRSPLTKSLARQYLPFWKNICSSPRGCIPRSAWETPPWVLQCVAQATAAEMSDSVLQGWIQSHTSISLWKVTQRVSYRL